jgi:hypothetical protein
MIHGGTEHPKVKALAEMLGVSRGALRDAREELEGEWGMVGSSVCLTEKGVRGALERLGIVLPEKEGGPGAVTMELVLGRARVPESQRDLMMRMKGKFWPGVVKGLTGNARMVMGVLEGQGGEVRVLVRDSSRCRPGDLMVLRQVAGDMWEEFEVLARAGR